ncbi:universal stress protein [Pseudonocardia bannensis]|uniref:Universal stress protein n=1 Tax=Pseudonocardia bannensis TaxID=630973 RepID=A0A848DEP1_9PSEU|nr:universal stress protein [Pseudonocardia bannensis]NMH91090.1 universal stress protein [Pseudonocardia bannensis]
MSMARRPVTVWAGHPVRGRAAVRWGAAQAARTGRLLRVVLPERHADRIVDLAVVTGMLAAVRRAIPEVAVSAEEIGEATGPALRALSGDASVLVVEASTPQLGAVVAGSFCPVVIVPEDEVRTDGPVVLGAAPWTGDEVFDTAFRAAADRGVPLQPVRAWTDPRIDLGRLLPSRLARWDAAEQRARRELEIALSAWTVAYPAVEVQPLVVNDRPAEFLLALSHRAQLLVLGRSERGTLLSGITGSPVEELARQAHCPVMIVPAAGPPRRTWLPSRRRGLAELSS